MFNSQTLLDLVGKRNLPVQQAPDAYVRFRHDVEASNVEPLTDLNVWEYRLVKSVENGEEADFSGKSQLDDTPVIRAALIRALLVGLPISVSHEEDVKPVRVATSVNARGFRIDGILDLTDAIGPDGKPLHALLLREVMIERFEARHARLARLTLKDCRFAYVDLEGAKIDGPVDFSGSRPFHDGGDCAICGRGADIGGNFDANSAWLKYTPREHIPQDLPKRYALDLSGASIRGSIHLNIGFKADGGVSVRNAYLNRSVWALGARFTKGEGDAFNAQSADINGSVVLSIAETEAAKRFEAKGSIKLLGAVIGGSLSCVGASLDGQKGDAVNADGAKIGGDVMLAAETGNAEPLRFEAKGTVRLWGATIGGSLSCSGASLDGQEGYALTAEGARIDGAVLLRATETSRFEAKGAVRLLGATIGSNLSCAGACLDGQKGDTLNAVRAMIGGDVLLRATETSRFEAKGTIRLSGATIGGSLSCTGASLDGQGRQALTAEGTRIDGAVFLRATGSSRFEAKGTVRLLSAIIGGNLSCAGASLNGQRGDALTATNAKISGDVFLTTVADLRFEAKGTVRLLGATIVGNLECAGASLNGQRGDALAADDAKIGGDVLFRATETLRFEAKGTIRLYGASIVGNLSCAGALLDGQRGDALTADGARIGGAVLLRATETLRFEAKGTVRLYRATIGGNLSFAGASLDGQEGDALNAVNAKIDGDVFLATVAGRTELLQFEARGTVRLYRTTIGGSLSCSGASLNGQNGDALNAEGAKIDGAVFLRGIGTLRFEAKGTVRLSGATIGSSLSCSGASLDGQEGYALTAEGARIDGAVLLRATETSRFEAKGAVRLLGATIGGNLSCAGALLDGQKGDSLNAVSANISGNVLLSTTDSKTDPQRFEAKGTVWLHGATIGGILACAGAHLDGQKSDAFNADGAKIGGDVFFATVAGKTSPLRFESEGTVRLYRATIGGNLECAGALLNGQRGDALNITNAKISGDVFLATVAALRLEAKGTVGLLGATIGGNLSCAGASLDGQRGDALNATNAKIGGDVFLATVAGKAEPLRFEAKATVRLLGATIGGDLECTGASLDGQNEDALNAINAKISGNVFLRAYQETIRGKSKTVRYCSRGAITLSRATVRGTIECYDADLSTINARALNLDGDLKFAPDLTGLADFGRAHFGGAVDVSHLTLNCSEKDSPRLNMRDAKIASRLKVEHIQVCTPEGGAKPQKAHNAHNKPPIIDLSNVQCATLDDKAGSGWGKQVQLQLDGLTYNKLASERSEGRSPYEARKAWLRLQYPSGYPTREDWCSQPYEQLACVLYAQGDNNGKQILALKMRYEGEVFLPGWFQPFWILYGIAFKYGLGVYQSLCTFIIIFIIGVIGVHFAQTRQMLVVDTSPVVVMNMQSSIADKPQSIPCDDDIIPWVYALDLILPIVELRQEHRCRIRYHEKERPILPLQWLHIPNASGKPFLIYESTLWGFAQAIYSIIGWIVTSLTLLTVTGVLRRVAER